MTTPAAAPRRIVRRKRAAAPLALAAIVAVALALAGCGSSGSSSAATGGSSSASSGSWTYTDALGHTVTLDHRPERIAGLNDVIVSMLEYGIKPVASFGYSSLGEDQRFDGLDTEGITEVGTSYGQINLEKLVEARPELIVTYVYPVNAKGKIDRSEADYGFENMQQQEEVEKIAPVVTIYMGGNGEGVIEKTTELAESLGAESSVVAAAKAKFEKAKARLHEVGTASKATVTAMYADAEGVDVAKPADDPGLRMYRSDGVKLLSTEVPGYYWGAYSWENATKIGGDVLLYEQNGYDVKQLEAQPTFAANAALAAGQIHPWESSGMDYVQQTAYMEKLAGWIEESKVLE